MSYYYLFIMIFSIIVVFSCAYFKSIKEAFTSNNGNSNTIILMGDSILNNSKYVPTNKSVFANLKSKTSNVFNYAKDGATIDDLYSQLEQIPLEYNTDSTNIFISAGGNDILNKQIKLVDASIKRLFDKYMAFLAALRVKFGSAKINILNLYLPTNPRYKSYQQSVEQWNKLIKDNSTKIGEMYNVVDIYSLLNTPEDFVYDIEPSETASSKLANLIYLTR